MTTIGIFKIFNDDKSYKLQLVDYSNHPSQYHILAENNDTLDPPVSGTTLERLKASFEVFIETNCKCTPKYIPYNIMSGGSRLSRKHNNKSKKSRRRHTQNAGMRKMSRNRSKSKRHLKHKRLKWTSRKRKSQRKRRNRK